MITEIVLDSKDDEHEHIVLKICSHVKYGMVEVLIEDRENESCSTIVVSIDELRLALRRVTAK